MAALHIAVVFVALLLMAIIGVTPETCKSSRITDSRARLLCLLRREVVEVEGRSQASTCAELTTWFDNNQASSARSARQYDTWSCPSEVSQGCCDLFEELYTNIDYWDPFFNIPIKRGVSEDLPAETTRGSSPFTTCIDLDNWLKAEHGPVSGSDTPLGPMRGSFRCPSTMTHRCCFLLIHVYRYPSLFDPFLTQVVAKRDFNDETVDTKRNTARLEASLLRVLKTIQKS